jgi:hypothetical protein
VGSIVLFLPQNDTHAETAALLAPRLRDRGFTSTYLDMDGVFHQGIADHLRDMTSVASGLASDRPFYRMSPPRQLLVVRSALPNVERWLSRVDRLVAFNDGALQRLVFVQARKRGIPTDLVLDGMITFTDQGRSPGNMARRGLEWLGRQLDHSPLGAFLPSEVGLASVDRIHVAGEHSAEVLRTRGSRARVVLASGLPRWPEAERKTPRRIRTVLYLTGAFRWHNDAAMARAQLRDVAELAGICDKLGLALAVRVHPRDDAESYLGIKASLIDPRSESMTATIRRADLVISIVSTGLIEGVILGKPSRVLAIHPAWSKYRRAFVSDPLFGAIRETAELEAALAEMRSSVDRATVERQRSGLGKYVAATGREAVERIVEAISLPG